MNREHTSAPQGGASDGVDLATSLATVYEHSAPDLRARMLNLVLPAVGPLALSVLASGAFAKYLMRSRWQEVSVSVDDAVGASSEQVQALLRYVMQSDASVIERVCSTLAEQSVSMPALTVAAVALAMHMIQRRQRTSRLPAGKAIDD